MKKLILYLLLITFALTALIKNMQAQLITNDKNWNTTPSFIDNFTPPTPPDVRVWDNNWNDWPKWMADYLWGVTHGKGEHQVFQRENAIFNENDSSTIKLRATYEGWLDSTYSIPPSMDSVYSGWHKKLYYYSGAITTIEPILYGYFETRCKFPISRGSFPAFWLWGASDGNYREIDIFEYSWIFNDYPFYNFNPNDSTRQFTGGIWYSNHDTINTRYGDHGYIIPPSDPDLLNYHTYGVDWSPKRVVWYYDNKVIGEFYGDSVPSQSMRLLLNYSLDDKVLLYDSIPIQWSFPNNMTVDYVRINKLKCDCNTNAIIQNNTQLSSFNYSVKNTITVGGYGYPISIPSSSKVVFRADSAITINGDFEVPLGSEVDLITHPCPE